MFLARQLPVEHVSGWDPTAWTTLGLAVMTLLAVIVSFLALRQTQSELSLSREEVRQSHRPLLVCTLASFEERVVSRDLNTTSQGVLLTVENIGVGPAVDAVARVQLRGDDGRPSLGGGTNWWTGLQMGIGASSVREFYVLVDRLADLPCFAFELTYADVAGERWYTTGIYLTHRSTGIGPTVVQPQVGRVPEDGVVSEATMPEPPAALDGGAEGI